MNIRDKLRKLDRDPGSQRPEPARKSGPDLSSYFTDGFTADNDSFFVNTCQYNPDHKHGLYQLYDLINFTDKDIRNITGIETDLPSLSYQDLLFIDTETTGLMGGTGTLPFLIGIGYFRNDKFKIEQFFMRDFDEERPVLETLQTKLENYTVLVSFNGKSFDLPLLKTRMIMNHQPELNIPFHFDLLHPVRSLWSHLDSCSLNNLEKQILNITRDNDLPGKEVPRMYFKYLNENRPQYIEPIFTHNLIDIISMVTLLIHLQKIHTDSTAHNSSAHLLYNLGRLYEKRKDLDTSIIYYKQALQLKPEPVLCKEIKIHLSWQYKRKEQWGKAVQIWRSMIQNNQGGIFPWRELAKYQEHQQKDFLQARKLTLKALDLLKEKRIIYSDFKKQKEKLYHRLRRLENKI